MFEYFRDGHVPECDDLQDLPDIFNAPTGEGDQDEEEEPESLF
jgi:hypothetical protein